MKMTACSFVGMISIALTIPFLLHFAASRAFAQAPDRSPGGGPPGFGKGPRMDAHEPLFPSATVPRNDRERAALAVLEDMDRTQRAGSLSVPANDGRLLRILAEAADARHVVELGTSIGYSGIWFCLALESTGGKLTTFEIDEARAATARANFKRAGVENRVTLVFGDAHQKVVEVQGPIDVVFLDADKEGYLDYLQKLLPKVRPGGLVIAHNMNRRQADPKYVEAITRNSELETLFVSAGASGIGVSLKKR